MLTVLVGATEPVAVELKRSTPPAPFEAKRLPAVPAERLYRVVRPVVVLKGMERIG